LQFQASLRPIECVQKKTFYGKEKKSVAYIIRVMNMISHGIEAPNIQHSNTLAENISDIQDKDSLTWIFFDRLFQQAILILKALPVARLPI
jgi:type I restriction-modification system DNA methylase subunit